MNNPSFKFLRPVAIIAGTIGVLQGLAWTAMAITGIVAYYCLFDFSNVTETQGGLFEITFFRMYFSGTCEQGDISSGLNTNILNTFDHFSSTDFHAFLWTYLIISFIWMISSFTLITNVTLDGIRHANIFLIVWIVFTLIISILDLTLGILFSIDFNWIRNYLYESNLTVLNISGFVMENAKTVSGIMMSIAFRGYLLWLINIALAVYFIYEVVRIMDSNKRGLTGTTNRGYSSEPHSMLKRHPIDAYGDPSIWNTPTTQPAPVQQSRPRTRSFTAMPYDDRVERSRDPYIINHQPAPVVYPSNRRTVSDKNNDVVLRRDAQASIARELNNRNSTVTPHHQTHSNGRPQNNNNHNPNEIAVPEPDYSPVMQRAFDARPPLKSALRGSRYE